MIPLSADFMIFVGIIYAAFLFTVFVIWFLGNIAWIVSETAALISRVFGG